MYKKQELIDNLNVVKQEAVNGGITWKHHGICSNWSEKLNDDSIAYVLVNNISPTWKEYSGEVGRPIKGYFLSKNLWEGEQLELRLSLIDHILKFLEVVDQQWLDKLYSERFDDLVNN